MKLQSQLSVLRKKHQASLFLKEIKEPQGTVLMMTGKKEGLQFRLLSKDLMVNQTSTSTGLNFSVHRDMIVNIMAQ